MLLYLGPVYQVSSAAKPRLFHRLLEIYSVVVAFAHSLLLKLYPAFVSLVACVFTALPMFFYERSRFEIVQLLGI
jgi:hypothetical protein